MKLKLSNLKKVFLLCSFFYVLNSNAQAPEKMSYQAVIRNTANALVTNQAVGMRISILQGAASGMGAYVETQTPTTNANGLVSLEIGSGTVVAGTFANINWANGPYFIKTETDPTGGTSYTITGTSQLLSSPYALYAKNGTPTGGTAGQVLTTDGTNASWATPSFPSIELRATKTAAQTLAATDITVAQTTTGEAVVYSATNDAHAALTGGNTWDGTTFTVGSTGAGWYQLTSQLMAYNTISNIVNNTISMLIEINATSASSIYGTTTYNIGNVALPQFSIRSVATGVVYLSAGDVVKIKAKGSATQSQLALRVDGSTYFSVVRLK